MVQSQRLEIWIENGMKFLRALESFMGRTDYTADSFKGSVIVNGSSRIC